jgi:hypothetical protein
METVGNGNIYLEGEAAQTYFRNLEDQLGHPAPGDKIKNNRIVMEVLKILKILPGSKGQKSPEKHLVKHLVRASEIGDFGMIGFFLK